MKRIAELIIAALDHFCHTVCPYCERGIYWSEYHTHEEVEKWVAEHLGKQKVCRPCGAKWSDDVGYCPNCHSTSYVMRSV